MSFLRRVSPVLFALAAVSQAQTPAGSGSVFFAKDFNFSVQSQSSNTYQFSPANLCYASLAPVAFFDFTAGQKVLIQDATNANTEVVTVASATTLGGKCAISVAPVNQHYSFRLTSGTAGLQEAINVLGSTANAYPAVIYLDRGWYQAVNGIPGATAAGILAAAKGTTKANIVDLTTLPFTNYAWNGTAYAVVTYAAH